MDAAGRVRLAALETLAEIEPATLATELRSIVREASMVPGVVTIRTAERLGAPGESALDRAVGVQLSYEGLRLTRQLIREEERYAAANPTDSYLSLVAGEVLVSRGFGELAETAVAGQAIEIVQEFSRNQTVDYRSDVVSGTSGRSLERDVVALAVAAGSTAVLDTVPTFLVEFGDTLSAELDREPMPPSTEVDRRIRNGLDAAVTAEDAIAVND